MARRLKLILKGSCSVLDLRGPINIKMCGDLGDDSVG